MSSANIFENLFLALPELKNHHAPGSRVYNLLKQVVRKEVERLFNEQETNAKEFKPFGNLVFPYHKMGAIDSLNLFDLDELIIFSFYWTNRKRYHRVLDAGANIGLHAILLSKCGFDVISYEPDPLNFERLQKNLTRNNCSNVKVVNAAVSTKNGIMEFIRVLGNLTGSHLEGSKANPYGELQRFPVKVESIEPLLKWADLVKLDVEGHEKEVLLSTNQEHWLNIDALVEIENQTNATAVYEHFKKIGVNIFSQKTNWHLVKDISDMPTSYREGTLFITCKEEMPWSSTL